MKKSEFKAELLKLFDSEIEKLSFDEKILLIEKTLIEYQKKNEDKRDVSNKRKLWTDDELRLILLEAPTETNSLKFAKFFKRGYGSIEQIYRWAGETNQDVKNSRPDDKFIKQIKKIAKEVGFRA